MGLLKGDLEGRSVSELAAQRHRRTDQRREPTDDRQAQAQAASAIKLGISDLKELLEDTFLCIERYAWAGIAHLDDDGAPIRLGV